MNNQQINKKSRKLKICFVGKNISEIKKVKGPYIHLYYIYNELKKKGSLCTYNVNKIKNIPSLFFNDIIWVEYPCGRCSVFLVILAMLNRKRKLVLRIRDLPVEQAKSIAPNKKSTFFYAQVKFLENMIVKLADVIILSVPEFRNFIDVSTENIIPFLPGVSQKSLKKISDNDTTRRNRKHVLLYAGSLDRGGMIQKIINFFDGIEDWEFWIVGKKEQEQIKINSNTKYLGFMAHSDVLNLYQKADATIVPYPRGGYFDICIPLKIGEVLSSCKPVISTKLPLLSKYVKKIGLEDNMIYINEWTIENFKSSLNIAKKKSISRQNTLEKLEKISWDQKTVQLVEDVFSILDCQDNK